MISSLDGPIYESPQYLLQQLIRFNTTNPPGNERDCIYFIRDLLLESGISDTIIIAQEEHRPNLIARLKGCGDAPLFSCTGMLTL